MQTDGAFIVLIPSHEDFEHSGVGLRRVGGMCCLAWHTDPGAHPAHDPPGSTASVAHIDLNIVVLGLEAGQLNSDDITHGNAIVAKITAEHLNRLP